jgi:ParB family chromosome partitioning protein
MPRLQDLAEKRRDELFIPITKIRPGRNCRKDFSSVPDLAVSMFNMGQLESVEVYLSPDGDCAVLIDGERRFRAAQYVNAHFDEWSKDHPGGNRFDLVRCKYGPKTLSEGLRIIRQIEHNENHEALKPMEKAQAYKELIELGYTQQTIAKEVGKSVQHVSNYLAMCNAPQELQDAVETGRISPTAATKASKASPEKKKAAVEKVKTGEKVKIKDVSEVQPLGIGELKKCIKKAYHRQCISKKNTTEEAKWIGVKYGLEIAAGMHDSNI